MFVKHYHCTSWFLYFVHHGFVFVGVPTWRAHSGRHLPQRPSQGLRLLPLWMGTAHQCKYIIYDIISQAPSIKKWLLGAGAQSIVAEVITIVNRYSIPAIPDRKTGKIEAIRYPRNDSGGSNIRDFRGPWVPRFRTGQSNNYQPFSHCISYGTTAKISISQTHLLARGKCSIPWSSEAISSVIISEDFLHRANETHLGTLHSFLATLILIGLPDITVLPLPNILRSITILYTPMTRINI